MSFEHKSASHPDVPSPTRQARVILEICQNNVNKARIIAATNVIFATLGKHRLLVSSGSGVGFQGLGAFIVGPGQPRNGVEPLLFDGSESNRISTRHQGNVK